MEPAADRLRSILDRIEKAAVRAGRSPAEITLVAVTKTVSLERVLPFLQAGVHHVGENRVQEAIEKYQSSEGRKTIAAALHLIGRLQSNKAKRAVGLFDVIDSLDRIDLADDLNRHAQAAGKIMPCLVEVKLSSEETKSGMAPEQLDEFLEQLKSRTALTVKGLMGIAPLAATGDLARPYFAKLRTLREKAKLEVLSMGMSSDFEAAIAEGSTLVRVGTALFGPRVP